MLFIEVCVIGTHQPKFRQQLYQRTMVPILGMSPVPIGIGIQIADEHRWT